MNTVEQGSEPADLIALWRNPAAPAGKPRNAVSGTRRRRRLGSRRSGQPGARVAWNGRIGMFLREADDDQVEVLIGSRTYRVRRAEVRSA